MFQFNKMAPKFAKVAKLLEDCDRELAKDAQEIENPETPVNPEDPDDIEI